MLEPLFFDIVTQTLDGLVPENVFFRCHRTGERKGPKAGKSPTTMGCLQWRPISSGYGCHEIRLVSDQLIFTSSSLEDLHAQLRGKKARLREKSTTPPECRFPWGKAEGTGAMVVTAWSDGKPVMKWYLEKKQVKRFPQAKEGPLQRKPPAAAPVMAVIGVVCSTENNCDAEML